MSAKRIVSRTVLPRIGFFTDVEGNFDFFSRCVRNSRVLSWDGPTLELAPMCQFVYGGDVFDRGPGDWKIARALVALKKKYGNRVHLLIGNRDMNKMKLTSELSDDDIARPPVSIPNPYWVPQPQAVSFADFLSQNKLEANRATKLRWLLEYTMGCKGTIQHRKHEIAEADERPVDSVTDTDVAEAYLKELRPGGAIFDYLEHAVIAAVVGENLFVHGAVNDSNIGFVPLYGDGISHDFMHHEAVSGSTYVRVDSWVDALNCFARHGLEEWQRFPNWNSDRTWRGGSGLMGYGYSNAMRGCTVVTSNFLEKGSPAFLSPKVTRFLLKNNVRRVVAGHQPYGDSPGIIRQDGLEVIFADTSYSDPKSPDSRGAAVSEVLMDPWGDAQIHGVLADGTPYDCVVKESLGQRSVDGWWTKLAREDRILASRSKGHFDLEYVWVKHQS